MSDEQFRRCYTRLKQIESVAGQPARDPFPQELEAARSEVLEQAAEELGRPLTDEEIARLLEDEE